MKYKLWIIRLAVLSFCFCAEAKSEKGPPAEQQQKTPNVASCSTKRINSTPDLMQSSPEAGLPEGGRNYCGPVAVANSMAWLAKHGFPKLTEQKEVSTALQGKLARQLGEAMNTGYGTAPGAFLCGIANFIQSRGYELESLRYEGWEQHPEIYSQDVVRPDPAWIKQGLRDDASAAWLLIGWYKYNSSKDEYTSFAQHYVTVVGYGLDKRGNADPNILIIHDPAPRSGPAASHDYIRMEKLTHGRFGPHTGRKNLSANGWYKLSGDLKIKKGADCGILDGAFVLHLKPEKKK